MALQHSKTETVVSAFRFTEGPRLIETFQEHKRALITAFSKTRNVHQSSVTASYANRHTKQIASWDEQIDHSRGREPSSQEMLGIKRHVVSEVSKG